MHWVVSTLGVMRRAVIEPGAPMPEKSESAKIERAQHTSPTWRPRERYKWLKVENISISWVVRLMYKEVEVTTRYREPFGDKYPMTLGLN